MTENLKPCFKCGGTEIFHFKNGNVSCDKPSCMPMSERYTVEEWQSKPRTSALSLCPICGKTPILVNKRGAANNGNFKFVSCKATCMPLEEFYSPEAWNRMAERENKLKADIEALKLQVAALGQHPYSTHEIKYIDVSNPNVKIKPTTSENP